ncbi:MAG: benzoylformate decarboxylase [Betaproteobacteria bacterium]|nr:benzoylformate decarboxylase [Betaproteobacteria bacterium]
MTMTSLTVRDATLSVLRAYGMTTVFGNPGSTELKMFRDWPGDFRYVLGLNESCCVAMADAFAQVRRGASFVNLHSAAGVGHAMASIFNTYRNQSPVIVLAGQQTRAMFPTEPLLFATDAAQMPHPYIKWAVEPARAEDVPQALVRAYLMATQRPRGPVFLSVPEDDWDVPTAMPEIREVDDEVAMGTRALARLTQALQASRRPHIVVGAALDQAGAWGEIVALAERLEAPVWASPMSARCSFPEDHRLFAGFLPPVRSQLRSRLAAADVVLVVGAPVFTYHIHTEGPYIDDGILLLHLTEDPQHAARSPVGTSILCNLRIALQQLLASVPSDSRPAGKGRSRLPAPAATNPISGEYLMACIARTMPDDAIIVEEAPSHRIALHDFLPIRQTGGFYTEASGGLGWALPGAIGVALARPEQRILCLVGDGSSMYSIQALWNAVREKLRITFVVFNNRGYGALRAFSDALRISGAPGHEVPGLDFVQIALGFGCEARAVTRCQDVEPALRATYDATGPILLDVHLEAGFKPLY